MNRYGLTIAVPRGALLARDARRARRPRDRHREVRANDRKLLFEDAGIVTMRPSDVPTYVEAGAADIGITGKDVLIEQSERGGSTSCSTSATGRAGWSLATVEGEPDPADRGAAAARRRARGDEVPAHRDRASSSDTGRQAEIVEVKGSVELAPLTGLVEAIVDLTATGTTLRENRLVDARGDRRLDGAADRQPGRPQAQGRGDRPARRRGA